MQNLFPGHYRPNEEQLRELWEKATFILDANVLLNLYRYPQEAHDDLLSTLNNISDRLWIPHQVALEYQRNRLNAIAEQVKKYSDVRKIVEGTRTDLVNKLRGLQLEKRHSAIKVEQLAKDVEGAITNFMEELSQLENKQPDVFNEDKIRDEIDQLLAGKVGNPPATQKELDDIYEEGQKRYQRQCPPGYLDMPKSRDEEQFFTHNGLIFRKEYGDLILWKQILAEAKSHTLKYVVFITDDEKDDWWWKEDSRGEKIIGARPELVEEISREAHVLGFHIYTSSGFLEQAKSRLRAKVQDISIEQIRDISKADRRIKLPKNFDEIDDAVIKWIRGTVPLNSRILSSPNGFPNIIVVNPKSNRQEGYGIIKIEENSISLDLRKRIIDAKRALETFNLNSMTLFFVINSNFARAQLIHELEDIFNSIDLDRIHTLIAVVRRNNDTNKLELEVGVG